MSKDGQGTECRRNIAESFNRLSRAHERYRQTTDDGRAIAYSECKREFTFANNSLTRQIRHCVRCSQNSVLYISVAFAVNTTAHGDEILRPMIYWRASVVIDFVLHTWRVR